ncbi:MAG: asparagine synthase (glutamine-hydrolyzing), partial [Ectothiorhodospiraceae bacterium]|nr:asparagine synthase (glutamine-hydrolyzing) [Ectothiorhodospiraceae bacterium]
MCGIAGFCGSFEPSLLDAMNAVQAHRGPDDAGVWHDAANGVGLAHRRLSIIDLSPAGHQPMWDAGRRALICFNGEVFNYRELRAELERDGFAFVGHSDTEVVLNLYLRDGATALSRLNGMFGLAIWDTRERTLLLARDGMGVKPLYLAQTPRGMLFASELKALLCAPEVSRDIDPLALRHHLTYLWCPAPRSLLAGVRKLEPGQMLMLRDGRVVRDERFFRLPQESGRPAATTMLHDADMAVTAVREGVRTAVTRQMVADVEVGAFLSGGLDSSAVAAFARERMAGRRLQCFSIDLDARDAADEGMTADLPYARKVARHLDVDLHVVRAGPELADELATMLYHLDEPQADPAPLNVLMIARLAREHGIKVLLSGAGGDDLFSGYRRHAALSHERYWAWWPQRLRRWIAAGAGRLPASSVFGRRVGKALRHADRDADARLAGYFEWLEPDAADALLAPGLRSAVAGNADPLLTSLRMVADGVPPLERMLYLECRHFLADHNLNYTDKMSMAAGVEVRVPLLDPDLVALAARIPVHFKQHGHEGKWIFKRAMEGLLPRDVIHRPKTGFGVPLRAWLRGPLRELMQDTLSAASLRDRGWFDPKAVHALMERNHAGQIDA